jgi:hypothetical protein
VVARKLIVGTSHRYRSNRCFSRLNKCVPARVVNMGGYTFMETDQFNRFFVYIVRILLYGYRSNRNEEYCEKSNNSHFK